MNRSFSSFADAKVLTEWIRVAKVGGIIAFTHKATVWPKWEEQQEKLLQGQAWNVVYTSEPVDYLPTLKLKGKEYLDEKAKIYVFKKL